MRVALYCRISTDEDLQRYSLVNQEASLRRYVEERGWTISGVFVDRISGSKDKRPGLNRLLDSLSNGDADAVLVTEQDRLSRLDEIPWALLKQTFRDAGARLFTLSGEVDFHNEDDEFSADIMALIDRRRRKTIVRQMVRGRAGAAKRGEWLGRLPFGYRRNPDTKHLEPCAAEAQLVRQIFHLFSQGKMGSLRLAALMQDLIPTRRVDQSFIVHVLRNPVYAGDLVMEVGGESIRVEGAHEAIVSRGLWETCNRLLNTRGAENKKSRIESTVGLVAGMAYCADCGQLLSPTTAIKRVGGRLLTYHYYRHVRQHRNGALPDGRACRAAHRTEKVDADVRAQLAHIATSPTARRQLVRHLGDQKAVEELEATQGELTEQITSLNRKQERLLQLFLSGDWDRSRLNAEKRQLDRSVAALERELRQLQARMRLAKADTVSIDLITEAFAAAADLESLTFGDQQTVVHGLIQRVEINGDGRVTVIAKVSVAAPDTTAKQFAHRGTGAGQSRGKTEFRRL